MHSHLTPATCLILCASVACGSTIDVGQSNTDGGSSGADSAPADSHLTPGTASVTGTVGGQSLVVKDAIGALGNQGAVENELWVTLSNHADTCALLLQGAESFANATGLRLDISSGSSPPLTLGPGTYALGQSTATTPAFTATFFRTDAVCTAGIGNTNATAGTVTISAVTATSISGTFDLTFPTGALTGSFGASVCDGKPTGHVKCAP